MFANNKTILNIQNNNANELGAGGTTFDGASMTKRQPSVQTLSITASEVSMEQLRLHQTTQSLLMASSMIMSTGVLDAASFRALPAEASSNAAPPTDDGLNSVVTLKMEELLLRENYALHEKLKEVTSDRDRLLCEVSSLRLELDMSELKRLPEEK